MDRRTAPLDPPPMQDVPHHHHWDILMEFLGLTEPGAHRHEVAASRPADRYQRFRAELVAHRAWEQLLRGDCTQRQHEEWSSIMPTGFCHLTDDYELLVLTMWIWADFHIARVHFMTEMDPTVPLFDDSWLRAHLPAQQPILLKPVEKAWLCPQLCNTCRTARIRCPTCRATVRHWPPPIGGDCKGHTCIKEYPPCGAGPNFSPTTRRDIEGIWLQQVIETIEAHHAREDANRRPPGS
jgi:hypothetical protein